MRNHSGRSDPATQNKPAQWQARWREGCGGELAQPLGRRTTPSSWSLRERCDNAPILSGHNSLLCLSEPGRANAGTRAEPAGTRCRGSCASGHRQWGGTQHNSRCVWRMTGHRSCQPVPNGAQSISRGRIVCCHFQLRETRESACERSEIQFACLRCFSDRNGVGAVLAHGHCFGAEQFATSFVGRTQAERSEVQWS